MAGNHVIQAAVSVISLIGGHQRAIECFRLVNKLTDFFISLHSFI